MRVNSLIFPGEARAGIRLGSTRSIPKTEGEEAVYYPEVITRNEALKPDSLISVFLKNDSNSSEMNVSGTTGGGAKKFKYVVPSGSTFLAERLNILIVDRNMIPYGFGGLDILTNGIFVQHFSASGDRLKTFFDEGPIKTHSHFTYVAGVDLRLDPAGGVNDDSLSIRWTFNKVGAALLMEAGERMEFSIEDDLTDLTEFKAMIHGRLIDYGFKNELAEPAP